MMDSSSALNPEQVEQYFAHIGLPMRDLLMRNAQPDLETLSIIQAHHLSRIPFENLELHYSKAPRISLDVTDIYHKFIVAERGGYCMEHNLFLCHVLRFLGFQVHLTGARLHRDATTSAPGWSGWEHAVNIVTLDDQAQYLVDVGYGGDGPIVPVPLAVTGVTLPNLGIQELRLSYESVPGLSSRPDQKLWTYQIRNGADRAWRPCYAFSDLEFHPRDLEVMNFYTSQFPGSFLTTRVLAIRFLARDGHIYGKVVLDQDKVKVNTGGKSVLVQTCVTEAERVEVLRERFGVVLAQEQQQAMLGRNSAIIPGGAD
ncbi:arylamine N-acetyltransferase family protein [Aspergillus aculeatinus CBS 121060]|uniref:Arylamine N-acetyltransferase 1 n=1 Tax=Aspergillus aculeatinus CBS 121060 TaxID=1448322 RepID=A0ACD1HKN9_9EURO|nr:arylamine N-acetyltransferase 1 [Aspergillus aculeatinus CBS 121060]RAH73962.1 arylamine N-acetyltransferase 1 [Aspergillus aculeatinus CBS 121060]